jgi:mRNA interferase RelE/StbE
MKKTFHRLRFNSRAEKYLDRMNEPFKQKILDGLGGLKENPPKGDIEPLQGQADRYRLRVGGYRILFEEFVIDQRDFFLITKITPRGDAYKGGN